MKAERLLSSEYVASHPFDAARILERLEVAEAAALCDRLPAEVAARGLRSMAPASGANCLERIAEEQAGPILAALPLDTAAGLLRLTDAPQRERLLSLAPAELREPLKRLLRFPDGTAGALMDPLAPALSGDLSAGEALSHLKRSKRVLYYLYVIDREGTLVGVLNLRELMLAKPKQPLAAIMNDRIARLAPTDDRRTIVAHPGWRNVHALPVVDESGHFLGVVRHDTVRRLEQEGPSTSRSAETWTTALELGSLYWTGMMKALAAVASSLQRAPGTPDSEPPGGNHGADR